MLFTIAAAIAMVATFSAQSALGQFTNSIQCYYCQVSYIPGNTGAFVNYYGIDNGCGYPMNTTGNVMVVSCRGACVTQIGYDGSGK